ncbi:hypothetical protein B795N_04070 [Marinilactibacillus psychrotolerans]|nr:hypothetical protein B795N_04070 [Marinilactibacillus psychrotolerans]
MKGTLHKSSKIQYQHFLTKSRLFKRLGFGEYKNLEHMRREFNHLADRVPLELCKEWHAAVDVHGKAYRLNKNLDETWLFLSNI